MELPINQPSLDVASALPHVHFLHWEPPHTISSPNKRRGCFVNRNIANDTIRLAAKFDRTHWGLDFGDWILQVRSRAPKNDRTHPTQPSVRDLPQPCIRLK